MTYFAQQCKEHLHLVLAFSPLGSSLRDSVRYFPSLINCCTIDWFEVILFYLYSYHGNLTDCYIFQGMAGRSVGKCGRFLCGTDRHSSGFETESGGGL